MTKLRELTKVNFIDNVRIIIKVNTDNYIYIKPDQLSETLIDMIAKQIVPSMDLLLYVLIQESSVAENAVVINTTTWDGSVCERRIYRHYANGTFEEVSRDIF